jgi:hypothetical protein
MSSKGSTFSTKLRCHKREGGENPRFRRLLTVFPIGTIAVRHGLFPLEPSRSGRCQPLGRPSFSGVGIIERGHFAAGGFYRARSFSRLRVLSSEAILLLVDSIERGHFESGKSSPTLYRAEPFFWRRTLSSEAILNLIFVFILIRSDVVNPNLSSRARTWLTHVYHHREVRLTESAKALRLTSC